MSLVKPKPMTKQLLTEAPEEIARQVAEEFRFAVESNGPLFLLVHYVHEPDKIRFVEELRRHLASDGFSTQTFDPAHRPEHGAGHLYPLLSSVGDNTLSLVTSLPRARERSYPDATFLGYINLHRDDIGRRRLRWVLCLHTSEVNFFLDRAGDLWDVRQRTYWLDPVPGDRFRDTLIEPGVLPEPPAEPSIEANGEEIGREIRRVMDRVAEQSSAKQRARSLLDLAKWLNRRNEHEHAGHAAYAGLEQTANRSHTLRGALLLELGHAFEETGHFPEALTHYEESLRIARNHGNSQGEASVLNSIGLLHRSMNRPTEALKRFNESLSLFQGINDTEGIASTLNNIALIQQARGEIDEAIYFLERCLQATRETQNQSDEAIVLNNIGSLNIDKGRFREATKQLTEALESARAIGSIRTEGMVLANIGRSLQAQGLDDRAIESFQRSAAAFRKIGARVNEGNVLLSIASILRFWGKDEDALPLLSEGVQAYRELNARAAESIGLWNLGLTYSSLNDPPRAIEAMRASLRIAENLGQTDLDERRAQLAELEAQVSTQPAEVAEPARSIPYRADAE